MTEQTITLRGRDHFGRRVPPQALAPILELIPEVIRKAVRMRFEGRSRGKGPRPDWLKAATDVRFLGHDGDNETVLHFEAPELGHAASGLYASVNLRPTDPDPSDTGFDLMADMLRDVSDQKTDSELFDQPMLDSIARFGSFLCGPFRELTVAAHGRSADQSVAVTPAVVESAHHLHTNTPLPRQVRIVGRLDMVRASTRTFAVVLDDAQEVRGVLTDGEFDAVSRLMEQRVMVLGRAVFRPSGRLLRVDSESVSATTESGSFFSAVPTPVRKTFDLRDAVRDQSHKLGVAAVIGMWPGDETDEQVAEALRSLG